MAGLEKEPTDDKHSADGYCAEGEWSVAAMSSSNSIDLDSDGGRCIRKWLGDKGVGGRSSE